MIYMDGCRTSLSVEQLTSSESIWAGWELITVW